MGWIDDPFRFDDIGKTQDTKKMDPTFKKRHETASEVVIHLLLAAANGDVTAIQRCMIGYINMPKVAGFRFFHIATRTHD